MGKTVKMLAGGGFISACAIDATDIVERAREIHNTSPTASAALGRALSIGSLMGGMLKIEGGSITLQFSGNGAGGSIIVVATNSGDVRGYTQNPLMDVERRPDGKLDVGSYVGDEGRLTVIKDLRMREPYVGTVSLLGGEIAEDVASYFVESEQIPSAVAAGVLVSPDDKIRAAGAYIIQLLPGYSDELAEKIESAVLLSGSVSTALDSGLSPQELLEKILAGFEPQLLEEYAPQYRCFCSLERVSRALVSTGAEALQEMIDDNKGAELTCQFCDAVYTFTSEDLSSLLKNAK